ncbi:MAG: pentapeptide repeat-containing protein [Ktedonobacteraceae bacterium]
MNEPLERSSSASPTTIKCTVETAPVVPLQSPVRPAADDLIAWRTYWQIQNQPWRTEPEIDQKRQAEHDQRRAIVPDVKQGIYRFKGMKLSRADVEWLLATHENGYGPVNWSDETQRLREGLDLRGADLCCVDLSNLPLARLRGGLSEEEWRKAEENPSRYEAAAYMEKTVLSRAHLEGAILNRIFLERATLSEAHLERADLTSARLQHVRLRNAYLEDADLKWTHLEYAHLRGSNLRGVNLTSAYLEGAHLENVTLSNEKCIGLYVADIHWNDVNLAVIQWTQMTMLGDEYEAHQKDSNGKVKSSDIRLSEYQVAVRANRQLAVALQSQGLNEVAARFSYRAQVLQRIVFRLQIIQQRGVAIKQRMRALSAWLFSWFLFLIAGYGYRPSRSFLAYLLVIAGFATAYYFLGHTVGPMLSPLGAFVFSMTSFHGRGFFPGNNISLDDPLTVLASLEALVGLIIEVTFIATLTQRFFNR